MFRPSLVNNALFLGFLLLVAPIAHAQILTGYEHAPEELSSVLDSGDDFEPILEEYEPMLTAHNDVQSSAIEDKIIPSKTISYSNFLTSPVIKNSDIQSVASFDQQPVDLEADQMRYDETGKIITASGNVIIAQDGRILRADEVRYDVNQDLVHAEGNVVLNEENGDIHLSQEVDYSNKLQDGTVHDLHSTLVDGSRFSAVTGQRENGKKTIMNSASYTACEACKENPDARLPWRIRASKVVHDEEDARVSYQNARFNVYGVPVLYTPYFSHPDGTIDRKSGLLSPSLGYKSDLGAFVENKYYYDIAPDKDMTLGLLAMTEQVPLGLLEYRQRWDDAGLIVKGGATYSDHVDGQDTLTSDELRGHIFAEGLWDVNDEWRSGLDIAYVSDDQYARQYDITNEDVLQNRLYAERFSGRNYALGQMQLFQDIRVSDLQDDQPGVLPEVFAQFIGEPGDIPIIKGRWDAKVGLLSLFRDGSDQDMLRGSVDLGWKRRLVSDYGLVSDIDVSLRSDTYYISDRDAVLSDSGLSNETTESRFFPQIHMQSSYPMARNFENAQLMIEPVAAFTASPENDKNVSDIANEDSRDVQLDASNLFEANRFPGLDAVEDETRATYGLRTAVNGYDGGGGEVFIGQSYRFDEDSNPFQKGSGLSHQSSDVVGYIKGNYKDRYTVQYRFQLNNENLSPERHEVDAYGDWNRFRLNMGYLYAQALEGTEIDENREQISSSAQYYINDKWRLLLASQYDLGIDPGFRKNVFGVDYFGQCVSWSLQGVKNFTDDSSGNSDTEILFRIGLKNISEFARTGLRDEGVSP